MISFGNHVLIGGRGLNIYPIYTQGHRFINNINIISPIFGVVPLVVPMNLGRKDIGIP